LYIGELLRGEKDLARTDLIVIVSHVLSLTKEQILMEPQRTIGQEEWAQIRALMGRRKEGEPLAYLVRAREFFSESFYVDEHVLIPRPETETLVEEALSVMDRLDHPARVLDMGTGSGIIGTLLARNGAGRVLCVDISPDAILVARRNALRLRVDQRTLFVISDLFSSLKKEPVFDLICANLPYVGRDEWEELMIDVKSHEPENALLGGNTGVELYVRFAAEVIGYLRPGGALLLEIGSVAQASHLGGLLRSAGFEVTVKRDLAGRQRVLRGIWTSSS
jgi:release factor glutamine methyltransferase